MELFVLGQKIEDETYDPQAITLNPDEAYTGFMDDVTIWSKVLDPNEIAELQQSNPLGIEPDLQSFLTFDLAERVFDQTGNGFDGVLGAGAPGGTDEPSYSSVRRIGGRIDPASVEDDVFELTTSALNFDNGYVELPTEMLSGLGDFSATFWMKTDVLPQGSTVFSFAGSGEDNRYLVYFTDNGDTVNLAGGNGTVTNTIQWDVSGLLTSLADDSWHFIAITKSVGTNGNGGEAQLFVDGQLIGGAAVAGDQYAFPTIDRALIAQEQDGDFGGVLDPNQAFYGSLDEVGFWSAVLDQDTVTSLMTSRPVTGDARLLGYWGFNEDAGTVVRDRSGNGFDAFLMADAGGRFPVFTQDALPTTPPPYGAGYAEFDNTTIYLQNDPLYAGLGDEMTISFWLRSDDLTGPDPVVNNTPLAMLDFSSGSPVPLFSINFGPAGETLNIFSSANFGQLASFPSLPADLDDGGWHHIAVTRDGINDEVEAFIDGSSVGTVNHVLEGAAAWVAPEFFIGDLSALSPGGDLGGDLDEFAIWGDILTPAEISALVTARPNTDDSRLRSYLPLDGQYFEPDFGGLTVFATSDASLLRPNAAILNATLPGLETGTFGAPRFVANGPVDPGALGADTLPTDDDGTFRLRVLATGSSGETRIAERDLVVRNLDPTLVTSAQTTSYALPDPTAAPSISDLIEVDFAEQFADPSPEDTLTFEWQVTTDNGLEVPGFTGSTIAYTPVFPGVYTFEGVAIDDDGGQSAPFVFTAEVAAHAVVTEAPDVFEGDLIELDGLASSPLPPLSGYTRHYDWTIRRNSIEIGTQNDADLFRFIPTDEGSYEVDLVVRDENGVSTLTSSVATTSFTVSNAAPELVVPTFLRMDEGIFTLPFSVTDPGLDDLGDLGWTIDWNDGSPIETPGAAPGDSAPTHAFLESGTYGHPDRCRGSRRRLGEPHAHAPGRQRRGDDRPLRSGRWCGHSGRRSGRRRRASLRIRSLGRRRRRTRGHGRSGRRHDPHDRRPDRRERALHPRNRRRVLLHPRVRQQRPLRSRTPDRRRRRRDHDAIDRRPRRQPGSDDHGLLFAHAASSSRATSSPCRVRWRTSSAIPRASAPRSTSATVSSGRFSSKRAALRSVTRRA